MKLRCLFACLIWIQRLVTGSFASDTTPAKGGTRCFCNEASCVRTGYMCKSLLDVCFSLLSPDGHGVRSTHGCADSLPEASRGACANGSHETVEREAGAMLSDNGQTPRQRLLCCRQDMCNYMDGASVVLLSAISNNNNNNNNNVTATKSSPADSTVLQNGGQRELWFRVAVIAVPTIGLFILILLVVAAVRMLRGDVRRHQVGYDTTDVMAVDIYRQLIQHRPSARSQGIRICDGFCTTRNYPTCWVDFSDTKTPEHTSCVQSQGQHV